MGEKDNSHEDVVASAAAGETQDQGGAAAEETRRPPEQFHDQLVDLLRQSLSAEGEVAYQRWGLALFHSLTDEEVERQRESLGVAPKDALDFYNRGCLLAGREDFAGAAKAFEKAVELKPELSEAYINRALAYEKSGNNDAARTAWRAMLDKFADHEEATDVRQHLEALSQA